jgi:hypothetical protein
MTEDNKIIRGVWFAAAVGPMQQLCMKSYMDNGHEFHLYTAGPCAGVPEGVIVEDANAFMSQSERTRFRHNSQAADLCRVLIIQKEGGWYVDLDTVCLRPFAFQEPYVFVSEDVARFGKGQKQLSCPVTPCSEVPTGYISNSTFKAPAGAPFLQNMVDFIRRADTMHPARWESFGPDLFIREVANTPLRSYVKAPIVFDAANPDELYHLISGDAKYDVSEKSYAMHFRTSWWYLDGAPSLEVSHHPSSFYEHLKRVHSVAQPIESSNLAALVLISTGPTYCKSFLEPLLPDIKKFWPWADVLLFTDSAHKYDVTKQVYLKNQGWPNASLQRFDCFLSQREWLSQYAHVFYLDVDMRIVGTIGTSILSEGIVAATHPWFETGSGPTETRYQSKAYLPSAEARQYFCGAFVGGATQPFLTMSETIQRNIEIDKKNGVVAVWFDESHLNRYCYDSPPSKILSTDYCCRHDKRSPSTRIIAVDKDAQAFHKLGEL